jgi:probable rRNA maturation factor
MVSFASVDIQVTLKNRTKLKDFITNLFHQEGQGLHSLQYVFCDDAYLLEINKEFLKHDTLTDIVTFELSDDPEFTEGEIYISVERVKENADNYKVSFNKELHRVIFHGALHLCGYLDKQPEDVIVMRMKEDACLEAYFGK